MKLNHVQLVTQVAVWLSLLVQQTAGQTSKTEIAVRDCTGNEYLDTSSFQCIACPSPPNRPQDDNSLDADGGTESRVPDLATLFRPEISRSYTVATGCTCAPGWKVNEDDLLSEKPCQSSLAEFNFWCDSFRCIKCEQASSLDRKACMPCGDQNANSSTIYFDEASSSCKCVDPSHVIRERGPHGDLLPYKVCEPCPAGSVLRKLYLEAKKTEAIQESQPIMEEDQYICVKCPHPAMLVYEGKCVCSLPTDNNPTWTLVGVEGLGSGPTCVLTSETLVVNQPRANEVEYTHVVPYLESDSSKSITADSEDAAQSRLRRALQSTSGGQLSSGYTTHVVKNSIVFAHYFQIAGSKCRYLRDSAGVTACQALANLCALQMYDSQTPACDLLSDIHSRRSPWTEVSWDWRLMTPWLEYDESPQAVLSNTDIQMEFSFNMNQKPGTVDYLQFVLARFSLNGTFIGWTNVTSQFEYCQPTANRVPRWRQFGYGHKRSYACNLYNILRYFPEPEFYEMYLVDKANDGNLYPIPVRNRNLRRSGTYPNINTNIEQGADDILTRRFFFYDQISSKTSVAGEASVVRFAKSIVLTTTVQDTAAHKIYPPILDILYEERLVSSFFSAGIDVEGNPNPEATTVQVEFTVEYTENYDGFWRSTSVFFGICLTLVFLMALLRLYNWGRRNTRVPGDVPIDFMYLLRAISYLFSTFSSVFFWFLFVFAMYFFIFFKMQDNVHLLLPTYREALGSQNDYYPFYVTLQVCFFGQVARMLEIVLVQSNCDIFFLDWEKPRGRVVSKRGDGTKTKFAPISIWRTIFMANEWNELQQCRKYSLDFVLIVLATILIAGDVQYAATPTPNYQDLTPGTLNIVLRFFNTSFWFLIIAYAEILWKWAIQDRYITEPPTHSFVDLCTMAKTSVFILDEDYHGYYLHCRSQHEFADGSMLEISRQLRQEEEGLTTDRGLPGCPNRGQQTFEMYVTGDWKRQYNHIFRTLMQEELQNAHTDTSKALLRLLGKKGSKPAPEKLVKASKKLNAFLRSFIDQDSSEYKIQFRDQNFSHRFLRTPPEMSMGAKESIFFPDTFYDYDKVLFYGETWNLILFNVLTLSVMELWTDDLILAIFFTYLLDRFFLTFRTVFGNANLSAKTLVDERFLI